METRGRKRAEATSPAPSSPTTGPKTRSSKRIRLSATTTTTAAAIPATTAAVSSAPTRSRGASRSQDLLAKSSMDTKDESSGSAPRGRRGKQQRSGIEKADKGKGKGKGKEREKDTERNLGLNVDDGDKDDNNGEGGGGDLQQNLNLSSANTALQGLLRKLGAGLDDLLPSSAMTSGSSSHQNGRLKKILSGLRADGEQGKQVESLTQLCEILSIGTEDSLSTFSVDSFVPVLVRLLNHESNADIMLLSARALTHLCDVLPSSCAYVVHYGAVACFVARLLTIEYMDLAEQSLQALKKISEDHPTVCLRAGALMAVLSYLDFFSTGVQRVALSTAANMCMKLPPDAADFVMEAVPLLTNLLQYHDAKVVEHASVCLTRMAEAFSSSPEKLDKLCNSGLVTQAASLISTSSSVGGQAFLGTSTYTGLIRLLSTCASGSLLGTKSLLLLGISGILKDIVSGSGLVPDLSVSAALTRPPDQIFEIMNLANELLPALPQGTMSVPAGTNVFVRSSSKKSTTEVSPREKLLNEQPQLLQQFGMDLLPVLVQIYGSSVNGPARQKCLSVIAKLMFFSSAKLIESLSSSTNISSFLAGVLSWKDPQVLVLALKIADILMKKLPEVFSKMFVREGFVHAVDKLIISTSQPDNDKDPITETASRSTRCRRRGANSTVDLKSSEYSGNTNYSIRTFVSAIAKSFKDRHFAPNSTKSSVTDDLLHLTNLCSKLNGGLGDFKTKSKGKSKAYSAPPRFAGVSKEEDLTAVVLEMLTELSKGEGISTFEFIGSGVVSALLNYFSCGCFSRERASDSELPNLREQVLKRYKSFLAIALDSSVCESGVTHMSVLVQKLQNALSSVERFPVILRYNSRQQNASGQSQIQSFLSEHLKIRFCRAQGEKSVREHTPSVLLVDPLASLAAVEEFLWPRVRLTESEIAPVASTPLTTTRRGSTRSQSSVKGKAVLKTGLEESRGPHTRNAVHRSAALDKDLGIKPTDGISSNEVEDFDISHVDFNDAMVIKEDDVSDDEEFDQDEVLGDESFPMCAPDKVLDVKLTDSTEASTASDGHSNLASGSSSQTTFSSSGLMSFAAAAMDTLASANGQNSKQSRKLPKLIFSTCGKQLSRNITVYHAIQNQLILNEDNNETNVVHENISSDIYTIMYQSAGTRIAPSPSTLAKSSSRCTPTSLLDSIIQGELPCDLEKTQPTYNILALLRILESLNQLAPRLTMEKTSNSDEISVNRAKVSFEEFVNNKLTPKLARQIQDTFTICSGCLPLWCHQLMSACPFLFPFETRRQYFYSTAFGIPRAMNRLQHRQGSDGHGSLNEREVRVGRLHRQKVRISRSRILDSAKKVMEMCCDQRSVLEVEYFGEVGTGLGPTLEFFTLLSQEFRKSGMGLWREDLSLHASKDFVQAPLGLFPRPWNPNVESSVVIEYFRLVGRVIAKALQDGRLLDLPLSTAFYKLALGQELDLHDIVCFDAELGKVLHDLESIVCRRQYLKATGGDGDIDELSYNGCLISDLCLDFTLPGYPDYILKPGDNNVDINNLDEYITLVVDATLRTGIMRQIEAFRAGFNQVFDISTLRIFSPNELDILLCGRRELWEPESLADNIKFDHGYTSKSPPILNLLEIMGEFTVDQQRTFCQFMTGAPRLPPGGLASLNPKLTIVRKHSSTANNASSNASGASECADSDLPSVMTCANYLKLPPYSTKEIMYEKLMYAIKEGQGSFDLS